MKRFARLGAPLAVLALAAAVAGIARGSANAPKATTTPALLSGVAAGVEAKPLLNTGDKLGSFTFESIPDGISALKESESRVSLYVNHELSLVPFPAGFSDMDNASVSKLTLDTKTRNVLAGTYVIPGSANFQRFCSNFLATKEHKFNRPVLLTNEEAADRVNRTGSAYPAGPTAEQAGVVVAYDIRNDKYNAVYSMGRFNHENALALPGYKVSVILSGDDTFTAPASQLYLYLTHGAYGVTHDQGALYGFKSDDPAVNDYGDFTPGKNVAGTFVRVPVSIALSDQDALEKWSNDNGIFQFIRVEDLAYDRNSPNVVYFADTGEPRAIADTTTKRLKRGPSGTTGPYPNGRIFRLVLDKKNPLKVENLSVLVDGDSRGAVGAGDVTLIHNPDNVETTKNALLFQEDPGTQNQYAASNPNGTTARIWKYDLKSGQLNVVAKVNQTPLDANAAQGAWESSGIVDASASFGAGWFYTNVQAHSVLVASEKRADGITYKREAGQLLLLRIPGA